MKLFKYPFFIIALRVAPAKMLAIEYANNDQDNPSFIFGDESNWLHENGDIIMVLPDDIFDYLGDKIEEFESTLENLCDFITEKFADGLDVLEEMFGWLGDAFDSIKETGARDGLGLVAMGHWEAKLLAPNPYTAVGAVVVAEAWAAVEVGGDFAHGIGNAIGSAADATRGWFTPGS